MRKRQKQGSKQQRQCTDRGCSNWGRSGFAEGNIIRGPFREQAAAEGVAMTDSLTCWLL